MSAIEICDIEEEKLWMKSISNSPAFDFLSEPVEDVYSQKDGEPLYEKLVRDRIKDYKDNPKQELDFG